MKECYDCHSWAARRLENFHHTCKARRASKKWITGPSTARRASMAQFFQRFGEARKGIADWTDAVAKGEVPKIAPPRPMACSGIS